MTIALENWVKSAFTLSFKLLIYLISKNGLKMFCLRFSGKANFISQIDLDLLKPATSSFLLSLKPFKLLRLISRARVMWQIAKYKFDTKCQ